MVRTYVTGVLASEYKKFAIVFESNLNGSGERDVCNRGNVSGLGTWS